MRDVKWRYGVVLSFLNQPTENLATRVYISAEEWSSEMPWLECRKRVFGDGPGCVCYKCWPKEIRKDTRVSSSFLGGCYYLVERTRADVNLVP